MIKNLGVFKHFDDCFGRFRSIWNDAYLPSWKHLAFHLS